MDLEKKDVLNELTINAFTFQKKQNKKKKERQCKSVPDPDFEISGAVGGDRPDP